MRSVLLQSSSRKAIAALVSFRIEEISSTCREDANAIETAGRKPFLSRSSCLGLSTWRQRQNVTCEHSEMFFNSGLENIVLSPLILTAQHDSSPGNRTSVESCSISPFDLRRVCRDLPRDKPARLTSNVLGNSRITYATIYTFIPFFAQYFTINPGIFQPDRPHPHTDLNPSPYNPTRRTPFR